METFRFIKFQVYADSKTFYFACLSITKSLPRQYWSLVDQLNRASLSVCLNIAEGSGKYSDKEFHRYLEIAQGSINESFACLDITHDLKLITTKQYDELKEIGIGITRQLGGLEKSIRK